VGGNRIGYQKHPEWQPPKQQPQSATSLFNPVEEARAEERKRKQILDRLLRKLVDQHLLVNKNGQPACGVCGVIFSINGPNDVQKILEHLKGCKIISNAKAIIDRNQQYALVAKVFSRKPLKTIIIGNKEPSVYLRMAAASLGFWGRTSLVGWSPLVELLAENAKRTFGIPLAVKVEGNGNSGAVATLELAPTKKQEPAKTPEPKSKTGSATRVSEPTKTSPEPPSLSRVLKGEAKGEFQYGAWVVKA
jgi:hypothetical protein